MKSILSVIMTAALLLSALTACAARSGSSRVETRATSMPAATSTPAPAATPDTAAQPAGERNVVGNTARTAGNAVGDVVQGAGNAVGDVVQGAGNAVRDAGDAVGDMADDAARAAERPADGGRVNDTDGVIGNGR